MKYYFNKTRFCFLNLTISALIWVAVTPDKLFTAKLTKKQKIIDIQKKNPKKMKKKLILLASLAIVGLFLLATQTLGSENSFTPSYKQYFKKYPLKKTKTPFILEAGWEYVKIIFDEKTITKPGAKRSRADTIFSPEGHYDWDWKSQSALGIGSHNPGYTEKMIQHLVKEHSPTHLILTTGYQNVLWVCGKGLLKNKSNQSNLEKKVKKILSSNKFSAKVIILNTKQAIDRYNDLCINSNNRVVMAAHFTC